MGLETLQKNWIQSNMKIRTINQALVFNLTTLVAILMGGLAVSEAGPGVYLEVAAGNQARQNCVVSMPVPDMFKNQKHLTLFRLDKKQEIPVQMGQAGEQKELVWIMRDLLPAGATRKYQLLTGGPGSQQKEQVTVIDDGEHLNVKVAEKPVLTYNHAIVKAPKRDEAYYDKSGYIHPLYTPSGKVISDDFNPDHPHQHGIMLSWRKILFEGRENNGWDQKSQLGKVEHNQVNSFSGGPVFGSFTTTIDHIDLTKKSGPVTMLKEVWQVRVYALDEQFLFDIRSNQKCATDQPVTIDKIHYGGMTVRGHADWHGAEAYNYLTSEGKDKLTGNQSRPSWVEMYGRLGAETAGIAILDHPGNFRFPQPVRLHPTMPYFCFAVASLDPFIIEPGKSFDSRYRYYVHDGKPNAEQDQRLWEDYAHPPQVKIISAP